MAVALSNSSDRIKAALGAVALPGLLGYALITGLAVNMRTAVADGLKLFTVAPDPPPPPPPDPVVPHAVRSEKPEGAASPPNLTSKATQIVAPPPVIPLVKPPPVIAAAKASTGSDATTGAADIRGPGTGSGGIGDGTGSGRYGDGGGGGGEYTAPRWVRGSMSDSDYPRGLGEAGIQGTVSVRYTVGIDGRARDCEVTESSGSAVLDETTCRLIERRFRFRPSLDDRGRPVPATIVENHSWIVD
ncbi:energy transducer TonB [Sphingomonas gilva]|uniref:Energy transducer TonB n=1 Tax=Sphingomonas gilva TaxID=2305907 RepID=A0A396RS56_9SPHN|nr:energy transducer TonB [Sphingomonas gilva]RHW18896.1 energy transducer TonB [Sphingomonas gilva]